jgi:hypothetical protein
MNWTTRIRRLMTPLIAATGAACGGGGAGSAEPPPTTALPAGWTRLADLPTGVAKFGVAALDGRIVVAGGYDTRSAVWVYDIATDTWSAGPPLPRGTDNVAALATSNRIWAIGGEAGRALQSFDPVARAWTRAPDAPAVRFAAAAGELAGRLHVAGGWNANNAASNSLTRHDIFDPALQTWTAAAPLTTARNAAGGAVANGLFYVIGGRAPGIRRSDQQPLASVEVYNPATDSWAAGPPLPTARGSLAVASLAGRLYAFGGEDAAGGVSNAVERLDPATGSWTTLAAMPYRSHGLGAVVVGQAIYVLGGFTAASDAVGSESKALYRYTPP